MFSLLADSLTASAASDHSHLRLAGMLLVLVGGLASGYLASSRFDFDEEALPTGAAFLAAVARRAGESVLAEAS